MFALGDSTHSWRILLALFGFIYWMQAFSASNALNLENELLLDLRLDGQRLGLDVLGYQRGDAFLLSLDELTSGLGFAITIDAERGTADGWYISEDRQFSLDLNRSEVASDGKRWELSDTEAVLFQGSIFVDTSAFERWFPVNLNAVIRELYLNVEPNEPLPIQQRMNRRNRISPPSINNNEPQYPLQDHPFQFIAPHTTKLRLGYSTVRQSEGSDADYGLRYATLSRGDLGWMTSTISLAGQSDDTLSAARLKLERTAFIGPAGVNHVELGDIDASGSRGLLLRGGSSNDIQNGRPGYETVNLEGSRLPDWHVELYQNDQFIMSQTTGPDGQYFFENVSLQFGENRFELKFFGPNGEYETQEKSYFLGVGMLEPGRVDYQMSLVQSGRTMFGLSNTNSEGDSGTPVVEGSFNLGVSRNLTLGADVRSVEKDGKRVDSHIVGLGLSTAGFYSSLRYNDLSGNQNSLSTTLRTQLGKHSISLGYTRFFEASAMANSAQKWRGSFDIQSSVLGTPVKLEFNAQESDDSTQHDAVLGTTKSLPGAGQLASSLWYGSTESSTDEVANGRYQAGGQSSFHTVIQPWFFRLSASYGFAPESELLALSADGRLRIERDLTLDLGIRRSPGTNTTFYQTGINWQLDKVAINAQISYDSNERWAGLITLSTTLANQSGTLLPRLDSRASVEAGSVEVRVFNGDDMMEDHAYDGVVVNGVQAWRNATTDKDGVAFLSRMPAHQQTDIALDQSSLPQSELRSKYPGVSVIPRPGSHHIVDFPIIRTAEIEGHIITFRNDAEIPVSRALVTLQTQDGEIVAQTRSAFDGFYLFDAIEPGIYELVLEDSLIERIVKQPGIQTVRGDSGIITQADFILRAMSIAMTTDAQAGTVKNSAIEVPALQATRELSNTSSDMGDDPQTRSEEEWFVQLGAYASSELAEAYWERAATLTNLLRTKSPKLSQYRNMTRLLVSPGGSREAVNGLCQKLKARGLDCFVQKIQ